MQNAFISYQRAPSYPTAQLIQKILQIDYQIDAYLDVARADGAHMPFSDRLLNAIAASQVFVCLLSASTLNSEWVVKEIRYAHALGKPCLPVFQEDWAGYGGEDRAICYLLSFDGVHVMEKRGLFMDESIARIARIIKRTTTPRRTRLPVYMVGIMVFIALLAGVALIFIQQHASPASPLPSAVPSQHPIISSAQTATPRELKEVDYLATLHAMHTPIVMTRASQQTPEIIPTDAAAGVTEYAPLFFAAETSAMTTWLERTLIPAQSVGEQPFVRARAGVRANRDWTPHNETFDGIAMVLVPAGCFMMGSENGATDERPVHQVCFDAPFWFDQTEVTQTSFNRLGGVAFWSSAFTGLFRPVDSIDWFEARDFCARRGARLPTEAEWEFAARGPDGLVYPWGNLLIAVNAVHSGSAQNAAEDVMSRRGGVSWVGAYDMAGNVWEWTNSLYRLYPYNPTDGREANISANPADPARVVRGGSWGHSTRHLRAALRFRFTPDYRDDSIGFRCARSS